MWILQIIDKMKILKGTIVNTPDYWLDNDLKGTIVNTPDYWLDKDLKGTIVNEACYSLNEFEITTIVSLSMHRSWTRLYELWL